MYIVIINQSNLLLVASYSNCNDISCNQLQKELTSNVENVSSNKTRCIEDSLGTLETLQIHGLYDFKETFEELFKVSYNSICFAINTNASFRHQITAETAT